MNKLYLSASFVACAILSSGMAVANVNDFKAKNVKLINDTTSTLNVVYNIFSDFTSWTHGTFNNASAVGTGLSADSLHYTKSPTTGTLDIMKVSQGSDNCVFDIKIDNASTTAPVCTSGLTGTAQDVNGTLLLTVKTP
jgi:hypothetical protein